MRALQKLVRNGNSTGFTIPRTLLIRLGWLPGQAIIVEEAEGNVLVVRRPNERDFGPVVMPRVLDGDPREQHS
jgi:antitoxin component of MazEF toxin-antitoxin module